MCAFVWNARTDVFISAQKMCARTECLRRFDFVDLQAPVRLTAGPETPFLSPETHPSDLLLSPQRTYRKQKDWKDQYFILAVRVS